MKLITLDWETYFGKGYSLHDKGMTHQKYIMDERFKAHGCGIKVNDGPAKWITAKHVPAVLARIDWSDAAMIGHNLGFDASILAWRFGITPARYIDTLALARAQIGSNAIKHGLDALGELLLGSGKPDGLSATYGLRDLSPEIEAQLGAYCEDDCTKTWDLFKLLVKGMTKTELLAMDWCTRVYLTPKFMLDQEVLAEYLEELAVKKADALASVGMTDRDVLRSDAKFAAALESFGVDPPTKMGKPSKKTGLSKIGYAFAKTDQALKDLLDHPRPEVQALVAARLEIKSTNEESKATAYYESALLGGAWPVSIKYAGAMNTQRFSGDKHGGGNPQNLGKGSPVRKAICAPPGYKIMAADLSQIECRITMQLASYYYLLNRTVSDPPDCQEMRTLEMMRNGEDVYLWFGAMIYGRPIAKYDENGEPTVERKVAKECVLAFGFGMGATRFFNRCRENGVPMTKEMAERLKTLYRKTFPNVVKAWKASLRQLSNLLQGLSIPEFQRIVDPTKAKIGANLVPILYPENDPIFNQPGLKMPNGQYLKYPLLACETKGTRTEWSYWNKGNKVFVHPGLTFENLAQSLAGQLCREMLVELQAIFRAEDPGMGIELQVHDELVALIIDDPAWLAWARDQFDRVMQTAPSWMPELPVACETKEGYRYGECH